MLEELLGLVAQGGVRSYGDLTGALSISEPMLETLLDDLCVRGYVSSVDAGCADSCKSCGVSGCSVAGPGRIWTLTAKGEQAAARLGAAASAG
jgi:hypothetical protein